ncbi:MAG: hypothetical protein ACE5KE_07595 [Methanosarcinales archaeon]
MKKKFILKIKMGNQGFFKLSSNKGNIYCIPYFLYLDQNNPLHSSGLHLSIHSSGHTHIRSEKLNIHEDIDLKSLLNLTLLNLTLPDFAVNFYNKFQYQPDHNEKVLVIPISKIQTNKSGNEVVIDFSEIMSAVQSLIQSSYTIKTEQLQLLKSDALVLDPIKKIYIYKKGNIMIEFNNAKSLLNDMMPIMINNKFIQHFIKIISEITRTN